MSGGFDGEGCAQPEHPEQSRTPAVNCGSYSKCLDCEGWLGRWEWGSEQGAEGKKEFPGRDAHVTTPFSSPSSALSG